MKHEFSAGGIVYKKIENLLWLVCQHSYHKGWVFPKGLIGDNLKEESMEDAALRETKEETGVDAKIIVKLPNPAEYFYKWPSAAKAMAGKEGELIKKTVYYFLMEYVSGDIAYHDHEMQAVEWLKTEEVEKRLSYKADKKAFKEAIQIFSNLSSHS